VFLDNVDFRVTSKFGYRTHPVTQQQQAFHGGIDIVSNPARYPTRIKPIAAGRIIAIKRDVKGYSEKSGETGGNYVSIMHDDRMETRYKHLAYGSIPDNLDVGDYVSESDCIGNMGATGRVTGAHLHFEVCDYKVKGTEFLIDPLPYLQRIKTIKPMKGGAKMGYIKLEKTLEYGDRGEDVKLLQWRLCQLSAEIDKEMKSHSFKSTGEPDGGFGRGTENTLKKIQKAVGLAETGKLDKQTLEFLNADFISLYKIKNEKTLLEKAKAELQQDIDVLDKRLKDIKGAIDILKNL